MRPFTVGKGFVLGSYLFAVIKLTNKTAFDKCKCFGYGMGFDTRGSFLLSDGSGVGRSCEKKKKKKKVS